MSEMYWIGGLEERLAPDGAGVVPGLARLAARYGLRLDALEEVHWLGADPVAGANAAPTGRPVWFYWEDRPGMAHYLAHAAGRGMAAGEQHLVVLAEWASETFTAELFASPRAVGRYNLVPEARLAARLTFPSGAEDASSGLAALQAALVQGELAPEDVRLLAGSAWDQNGYGAAFPQAARVIGGRPGADGLALLHALLDMLKGSSLPAGMWMSAILPGPLLATLVERI
ncbi:MAG: hypothetical protein GYA17_14605 [Chloroflexi bacterium]|jgi:hypothetical protein|nr:hypothetical protein [Chloroflexota bacterium]